MKPRVAPPAREPGLRWQGRQPPKLPAAVVEPALAEADPLEEVDEEADVPEVEDEDDEAPEAVIGH